ncbi:MAG: ATP-dependent helicase [Chloroflexi bacterium]|nr:MAG: ATP-dependent helicase [Chloroflexota bacterium]
MKPTHEQQAVIEAAKKGGVVVVQAYAGAGKTATLRLVADELKDKRICYLAFNKSIVDEAKEKFGNNVVCRTAHSFAYQAVGKQYRDQLRTRLTGRIIKKLLELDNVDLPQIKKDDELSPVVTPVTLGSLILRCVNRYCASADDNISVKHVDLSTITVSLDEQIKQQLKAIIARHADVLWQKMVAREPGFGMTHDGYLKLWVQERPNMGFDVVLLDEAQDSSPVVIELVELQAKYGADVLVVGDSFQQIYAWRGAVDALTKFKATTTCHLTQSFRFGPNVAKKADEILQSLGATKPLRGFDQIDDAVGKVPFDEADAIICRTNGAIMEVMTQLERPYYVLGGVQHLISLLDAAVALANGEEVDNDVLAGCNTWQDLLDIAEEGADPDITRIVKIIQSGNAKKVRKALSRAQSYPSSDTVTLTTGHKAKGCEWGNVILWQDFKVPGEEGYNNGEGNLLYVAMTRAQKTLDITLLEAKLKQIEDAQEAETSEAEQSTVERASKRPGRPRRMLTLQDYPVMRRWVSRTLKKKYWRYIDQNNMQALDDILASSDDAKVATLLREHLNNKGWERLVAVLRTERYYERRTA